MKKVFKILCILLIINLITGCWDSSPLSTRAIVAGAGITRNDKGEIELIVQIIKPGALNPSTGGGGGGEEENTFNKTTTGATIFDAVRQLTKIVSRKLYWEHNRILVFSDEIAKEGIAQHLDFFMRDHESRKRAWIVICKENSKEVLETKGEIEKIPATEILDLMQAQGSTSQVAINDLHSLAIQLESPYTSPYASLVCTQECEGEKKPAFVGTCIFKDDKMVGYLDAVESRGFLWLKNDIKSGIIVVKSPADDISNIGLEIIHSKTKLEPKIINNEFIIDVNVSAIVTIGDVQAPIQFNNMEVFKEIGSRCESTIQSEIDACLRRLQQDFKTDPIGVGDKIYRKYPKQWSTIEEDWPNNFSDIKFNSYINVEIQHTGLITDPVFKHE